MIWIAVFSVFLFSIPAEVPLSKFPNLYLLEVVVWLYQYN